MAVPPTHALVRFIKRNIWAEVQVQNIWQFKEKTPIDDDNFFAGNLYSCQFDEDISKYEAVQIHCLGSEEKIRHEHLHSENRLQAQKFNASDIEANTFEHVENSQVTPPKKLRGRPPKMSLQERKKLIVPSKYVPSTGAEQSSSEKLPQQPSTSAQTTDAELEEYKKKLSDKEEELQRLQESLQRQLEKVGPVCTSTPLRTGPVVPARRELFCSAASPQSRKRKAQDRVEATGQGKILKFCFPKNFNYEEESLTVCNKKCMTQWTRETDEERMIHLAFGHSIKLESWNEVIRNRPNESKLTKRTARLLWSEDQLANRCLHLNTARGVAKFADRESPRKLVTPTKMYALRAALNKYLTKINTDLVAKADLPNALRKIVSHMSSEINFQCSTIEMAKAKQASNNEEEYNGVLNESH